MVNKAVLVGRLTKDPELKSTQSDTKVLGFTVAVTRKYKSADGERQTDFISCVAFRQTAEFITSWFKKGDMISVDGCIQTRNWEDGDGKRHYATEVIVSEAGFVGGSRDAPERTGAEDSDSGDDLPF